MQLGGYNLPSQHGLISAGVPRTCESSIGSEVGLQGFPNQI